MAIRDIKVVLRALAEARDSSFHHLWVDLGHRWSKSRPRIGFRIYQVADSDDVLVVLSVGGTDDQSTEWSWVTSVRTNGDRLEIEGSVSADPLEGDQLNTFERSASAADADDAARLVRELAVEVCSHRAG